MARTESKSENRLWVIPWVSLHVYLVSDVILSKALVKGLTTPPKITKLATKGQLRLWYMMDNWRDNPYVWSWCRATVAAGRCMLIKRGAVKLSFETESAILHQHCPIAVGRNLFPVPASR